MSKKILIIGASILQLPAIKKAKELGCYVIVADMNPNAIGISYADEFFNASTIDEKAIVEIAKKVRPDGVMTLATDMPMRTVAATTSVLGLPGISYETAIKATDKGVMMEAFKEHNVESPWFFIINNINDLHQYNNKFVYPCIIKPTDCAGSRGVVLVEDPSQLEAAYTYSQSQSRMGKVIVEEFLQGNEVSVEIMVINDIVHILAVTDKLTTGAPHFVEMGHSQPSNLTSNEVNKIKDLAVRAVKAVGINMGPAHVEIMLTKNGPKMIELGARMGGDCITSHLVPFSTGIDMIKATIHVSLGFRPDINSIFNKGSAIRYIKSPQGIIQKIEGLEEAKSIEGIQEVMCSKSVGEKIDDINSSIDRVGFVIAQANTNEEAISVCNRAIEKIHIITG